MFVYISSIILGQAPKPPFTIQNKPLIHNTCGYIAYIHFQHQHQHRTLCGITFCWCILKSGLTLNCNPKLNIHEIMALQGYVDQPCPLWDLNPQPQYMPEGIWHLNPPIHHDQDNSVYFTASKLFIWSLISPTFKFYSMQIFNRKNS